MVIREGKVIIEKGYGYADVEKQTPITPQTIFGVDAITKTFTALCILTLVDRGQIKLDDTLDKYLSDLPDS